MSGVARVVEGGVFDAYPPESGVRLERGKVPVHPAPSAFLAVVRDWENVEPHPLLAELARVCVECGRDLGDHGADDEPHGAGNAIDGCEGFTDV